MPENAFAEAVETLGKLNELEPPAIPGRFTAHRLDPVEAALLSACGCLGTRGRSKRSSNGVHSRGTDQRAADRRLIG